MFIVAGVVPSTGMVEKSSKSTMGRGILYVGGSGEGNYTKIQDAIDNASDGDTVFVYDDSSPYYENVEIDKSINLVGENRVTTIIDGNLTGDVVTISADWVNISGFLIINGYYPQFFGAGIMINSYYNTITGNDISKNSYCGIGISYKSGSNTATDNIITDNGNGVIIWDCSHNTIIDNNISGNKYGVNLIYSANHNIIADNIISSTSGNGIIIWHSSNYNIITGNRISWNSWNGIQIESSSIDNIIYHNNIIQNNQNSNDKCSNIWDNATLQQGNHWNDYTGSDNDGDSIGDEPYVISGGDNQDNYPLMYLFGPPYAEFTYNDETSEFDASMSGDYNGYIVSYEWDFGDGATGNEKIIYHKYCDMGTYDVTLTVTDDDGLKGYITKSVEVTKANIPPSLEIYGPNSGRPGVEYEYVFIVTDPDGAELYLRVDWGDGDSTDWMGPYSGEPVVKLSHKWNESGTYVIKAKVKDFCVESDWTELVVTMPRNKATTSSLFLQFLERFPLLEKLFFQIRM